MKTVIVFFVFAIAGSAGDPLAQWDLFEKAVRDQTVAKDSARKAFPPLYAALKTHAADNAFSQTDRWRFPVQGYSINDVGSGGFRPDIRYGSSPVKGYDFYDGNRHGGHPAYDIFIHDTNRDCRDDRTDKPVPVVAPVDLLVLSTFDGWKQGSELRGGNYVWALDCMHDELLYYAHLDTVTVAAGGVCRAGTVLGTVGRSGRNAAPARSPTHLHFMVLKVAGDRLTPVDYFSRTEKAGGRE